MAQAEIDTSTRSQTGQRSPPHPATRGHQVASQLPIAIQPVCWSEDPWFSLFRRFTSRRDDVLRLLTRTSSVVVRCQPWFYLRLKAYSFFWLSERAYG